MSGVLEKIVRPFQSPNASRVRRIPSEHVRSAEKVVLRIGRSGSGRTFSGSFSESMTFYCEAHQVEKRSDD